VRSDGGKEGRRYFPLSSHKFHFSLIKSDDEGEGQKWRASGEKCKQEFENFQLRVQ